MSSIPDNYTERKKLKEEIEKIESVYSPAVRTVLPDVKLQKLNYDAPSDAHLEAEATDNLRAYRAQSEQKIKDDSEQNAKALSAKREAFVKDMDADIAAIKSGYADAAAAIDSDVLKRGLARSSIAVNSKAGLERSYAEKDAAVKERYGKEIADIDAKISSVDSDLKKALNDFNLSYAVKLNDELTRLRSERDKRVEDVVKYNNDIAAKQADIDANKAKTESELYSEALDQRKKETSLDMLSPEARDKIYSAVYDKMDAFLGSLDPIDAKREILNRTLYRDHLDDYYYGRLYNKYVRNN